jgi:perosamine synthetase
MDKRNIPVAAPVFVGNEKAYVNDCIDSTWISSSGKYVDQFESGFASFCDVRHAISCCNGTTALHLALCALGVGPGDEVIVPTLSFVATANTIRYCGAVPVFVDSEPETWNIDPSLIESKITERTKGIIVVHLYGHPAHMDPIMAIARSHGLFVVEDAAEAHGAKYNGQCAGSIGDIAAFSFYGNKVITTGEGGMVVTNNNDLAARARLLRGQGMDSARRYWHSIVGYNYRMTNLVAAVGLAQLEKVDWHLERRLTIANAYKKLFAQVPGVTWQHEQPWAQHAYWMFSVLVNNAFDRDDIARILKDRGIETRPVFYPMHLLPPYEETTSYPVSEQISRAGLSLPTWAGMNDDDVHYVVASFAEALRALKELPVAHA